MDIKDIDELMAKMEKRKMHRISIKKGGFELELERESACVAYPAAVPPPVVHHADPAPVAAEAPKVEKRAGQEITSPIVGTFYAAPSPEDPPYIKVGDQVEPESVVCIIEAMKVMNEVKSGVRGRVVEVLMKNGDPVEYGSAIFRVE